LRQNILISVFRIFRARTQQFSVIYRCQQIGTSWFVAITFFIRRLFHNSVNSVA
jgi:hypothetical protein